MSNISPPKQKPPESPPVFLKLVRGIVCLAIIAVGLWTIQVYSKFLSGPSKPATIHPAELPKASIDERGIWQFPGVPWKIVAQHLKSEEQVVSQLTTWRKSPQSESPLWTMPWGWQSILTTEMGQMIHSPNGGNVVVLSQDKMKIAIWVDNNVCYGVRWAVQGENGDWILLEPRLSDLNETQVRLPDELLIPVAGSVQKVISRHGTANGISAQFLTTHVESLEAIFEGWRQAGWTIQRLSENSFGVWVSCRKEERMIDVLVSNNTDDSYSLTLWQMP